MPHVPRHHLGYGRMGMELYAACERAGVTMSSDPYQAQANTVVHVMIPPMVKGWLSDQRRVIFTMYETTECPAEFRSLQDFHLVLVPCEANVEAFSKWHPNVQRVPLGIDPEVWTYRKRPTAGPFTFLASGSEPRKGTDVAMRAFQRAFPTNPDVRLLVKHPTSSPIPIPSDPRIQVVSGYLSAQEELDLYASAHCYLGLSRGEGFGMMPLQALAQGCPTILSAAHGHAEFSHYGIPISTRLVPAADYMLFGEAGDWWEPDEDETVDAMLDVYANYDGYLNVARRRSGQVRRTWTWDAAAARLLDVLGDLPPYLGLGGRERRTEMEVPIRVTRPIACHIGDRDYDLVPGHEYWVPGDAKRVLREAGYIDDQSWDDWRWKAPEVIRT